MRKPDYQKLFRERFDDAKEFATFNGVDAHFTTYKGPDGSVEGEIRFVRPTGYDSAQLLIDVESWLTVPRSAWVSVGARFEPTTRVTEHIRDPKRGSYYMVQGMVQIASYGQRGRQKAANFLEARHAASVMESRTQRKMAEVFVRLRFDPDDKKMPHKGTAIEKLKKKKPKKGKKNVGRKSADRMGARKRGKRKGTSRTRLSGKRAKAPLRRKPAKKSHASKRKPKPRGSKRH